MTLLQLEDWERDMIVDTLRGDIADTEFAASDGLIKLVDKLTKPEEAKIELKFQVFLRNNGDGSAYTYFFNTEEEAEEYASKDWERLCDDVFPETITINGLGQIKDIPKRQDD